MTTYGAQMNRKWTRSGLEVTGCGPEVRQKWTGSVRLSIPNTSLTSLTNLMRGIYKRRALAPCDFSLITLWWINVLHCGTKFKKKWILGHWIFSWYTLDWLLFFKNSPTQKAGFPAFWLWSQRSPGKIFLPWHENWDRYKRSLFIKRFRLIN